MLMDSQAGDVNSKNVKILSEDFDKPPPPFESIFYDYQDELDYMRSLHAAKIIPTKTKKNAENVEINPPKERKIMQQINYQNTTRDLEMADPLFIDDEGDFVVDCDYKYNPQLPPRILATGQNWGQHAPLIKGKRYTHVYVHICIYICIYVYVYIHR